MKILFTTDTFLPEVRGGAELYLYYLASALREAGHDVFVMHTEPADEFSLSDCVTDGLPCRVIHKPYVSSAHSDFFAGPIEQVERVFEAICGEFARHRSHQPIEKAFTAHSAISRRRGAAVIFTLHDYWLKCDRGDLRTGGELCEGPSPSACADCNRWRYARWSDWKPAGNPVPRKSVKQRVKDILYRVERPQLERAFVARSKWVQEVVDGTTTFVCPSRFLLETIARFGIPREKLHYSDYGMPIDVFATVPARVKRDRLRFGYLGGVSELKGLAVLLDAFEGFADADLWIFGKVYANIADRVERACGQSNIEYKGVLYDDEKSRVLSQLDALIVPSVWFENSPLVIHEAYLARIPVVTSNIGGMKELVPDGVSGVQFEVGNAADLRRKLSELCQNPTRIDELRARVPHVKSMDEHVPEILTLYQNAMQSVDRAVPERANV